MIVNAKDPPELFGRPMLDNTLLLDHVVNFGHCAIPAGLRVLSKKAAFGGIAMWGWDLHIEIPLKYYENLLCDTLYI